MNCPNSKVIRAVHSLMSRLINTFPTEPFNSSVASKHDELEQVQHSSIKLLRFAQSKEDVLFIVSSIHRVLLESKFIADYYWV